MNIDHLENRFAEQCTVLNWPASVPVQFLVVAEVAQVFGASLWQQSIESMLTLVENSFLYESGDRNIASEFCGSNIFFSNLGYLRHRDWLTSSVELAHFRGV